MGPEDFLEPFPRRLSLSHSGIMGDPDHYVGDANLLRSSEPIEMGVMVGVDLLVRHLDCSGDFVLEKFFNCEPAPEKFPVLLKCEVVAAEGTRESFL
jgi:hypothetical protein